MFQVLNKVTGGKPRATRRSSGGRRVILKALKGQPFFWYCTNIYNDIPDTFAPLKTKRVKRRMQPKWFTNDMALSEIKTRDKLQGVPKLLK